MLVLSRQRDESIMFGDKVVVTIVDIRGDKVRLGIEAPDEIPVHRQEVYEAIRRENRRRASRSRRSSATRAGEGRFLRTLHEHELYRPQDEVAGVRSTGFSRNPAEKAALRRNYATAHFRPFAV